MDTNDYFEWLDAQSSYYERLAAAHVRGATLRVGGTLPSEVLLQKPLEELTQEDLRILLEQAELSPERGLLYYFGRAERDLPRVKRVMGFLKSIPFDSLLDVGSGRGLFLFPFLEEFPRVRVTGMDILPHQVLVLEDLHRGGVERLRGVEADVCAQPFPDDSFDVVTLLEVLEHIPDVDAAVRAAVRMAKKYVVVTVPSKPDNNPGHIHLLTKSVLTELFTAAGCARLHFDGVNGHLVLVAAL